jgi:hypothetical protein
LRDNVRASHGRRRGSAIATLLLAAVTCSLGNSPGLTATAASTTGSIDAGARTNLGDTGTAYEIRATSAMAGSESLELAARLTADGGMIQRPIAWKLHRLDGETVFTGSLPTVTTAAEPGDYVIEANYGSVHAAQRVSLPKRQQVAVTLILNVGGVRILSRLPDMSPSDIHPLNTIYATSGPDQGKLVTISERPGEIMRLAAGTYHIESRFAPGNAVATADVTVRPGLLSSVEIDHHAGIVHLSAGSGAARDARWAISDDKGHDLSVDGGGDVVLLPGHYFAHVSLGREDRTIGFTVESGKRIEIVAR